MTDARIAVGVLAGGQGTRVGGADKGWIERGGQPQIAWVLAALSANAAALAAAGERRIDSVLISANRNLERYRALGVGVVTDCRSGYSGPMAGIASLVEAMACTDASLLTIPVDHDNLPPDFVLRMVGTAASAEVCVVASDSDGIQPLFALYPPRCARALAEAFAAGERSVSRWQQSVTPRICRFEPLRFGNLNSPDDVATP